jgi:eukaryotic-like serine/threonine-protein kinase
MLPPGPSASLTPSPSPSRLGPYELLSLLGRGGMGEVYRARDTRLTRTVAIKVLPAALSDSVQARSRFQREARAIASLSHPNVCVVHDVGNEGGLHFIVMEYLDGESLSARLHRGPLPLSELLVRGIEIVSGLEHAHAAGIVHRDVKPANIMLDAESRVLLTDFGISKAAVVRDNATTAAALTEFGTVLGTPHYLAPEQALSRTVDGRADQYALAIVGYEMLTGSVPFDDETPHGIIHRHVNELPPRVAALRPEVPEHISAAIARALLKAPSHRFAAMEDFARALDPDTDRAARRWRIVRQAAAALLSAAVLAAAVWMSGVAR